jgi:hypothetical protein
VLVAAVGIAKAIPRHHRPTTTPSRCGSEQLSGASGSHAVALTAGALGTAEDAGERGGDGDRGLEPGVRRLVGVRGDPAEEMVAGGTHGRGVVRSCPQCHDVLIQQL